MDGSIDDFREGAVEARKKWKMSDDLFLIIGKIIRRRRLERREQENFSDFKGDCYAA